jgi:hypothetical protein
MKHVRQLRDVQFIWDRMLAPGQIKIDADGVWHVGHGTDLQDVLFRANLTDFDMDMLHAMKIEVE